MHISFRYLPTTDAVFRGPKHVLWIPSFELHLPRLLTVLTALLSSVLLWRCVYVCVYIHTLKYTWQVALRLLLSLRSDHIFSGVLFSLVCLNSNLVLHCKRALGRVRACCVHVMTQKGSMPFIVRPWKGPFAELEYVDWC